MPKRRVGIRDSTCQEVMMKMLFAIAALLLASTAAQAQYTFEYGGRTIRIDPDRGTVSIPGVYDNSGGGRNARMATRTTSIRRLNRRRSIRRRRPRNLHRPTPPPRPPMLRPIRRMPRPPSRPRITRLRHSLRPARLPRKFSRTPPPPSRPPLPRVRRRLRSSRPRRRPPSRPLLRFRRPIRRSACG